MRALAIAAVLLVPAVASADATRLTLGASAGLSQDKNDALDGHDSLQSLGVWGRLKLTKRLSGQLELAKQENRSGCSTCTFGTTTSVRTSTALLVVDLADGGRWMPLLLVGAGLDRDTGSIPTEGHHIEGGFGIEYRAMAGLLIGADVRMGGRTIDSQGDMLLIEPAVVAPGLKAGEYRSARITFGVRF